MRASLLHLDEALVGQDALLARVLANDGQSLDLRDLGPRLRLWSRPAALAELRGRLRAAMPANAGPMLVFCGSGDFHHITPILLQRAIEAPESQIGGREAVTVLHFDNHPDWVRFSNGTHCGSWVGQAARLPGVAKVITVGVCSPDIRKPDPRRADLDLLAEQRLELYAYRDPNGGRSVELGGRAWPTIEGMGEAAFAALLCSRIGSEAIYITIDKDVLSPGDAATNWDQGRTSLSLLKTLLAAALRGRRLIGADVVGDWSAPVYGGGPVTRLLKRGEAWLDQPRTSPDGAALAANEGVNLQLLDLLLETPSRLEAVA